MALNEQESKLKETMERIPKSGFPIGYANIMRATIDAYGNFTADVRRYFSETERQENEYQIPGLIGVGGPIPQEVKDKVFSLVYPYLELEINRTYLWEEKQKEIKDIPEGVAGEEKAKLQEEIESKYEKLFAETEKTILG